MTTTIARNRLQWLQPEGGRRFYLYQKEPTGTWKVIDRTVDLAVSPPRKTKAAAEQVFMRSWEKGGEHGLRVFN